jgi:hypothetical protein
VIELLTDKNAATVLRSSLLSQVLVPHGFSTRNSGEVDQHLMKVIGCNGQKRCWVNQVHGGCVKRMTVESANDHGDADALMTDQAGIVLSVRVADCVPVLVAAKTGSVVVAIHAGWRGIVAGVIDNSIAKIHEAFDIQSGELVAAVGPCIGPEHFEVGDEVAAAFDQAGLSSTVIRSKDKKPHIDLLAAAVSQLQAAGIPNESIDQSSYCTYRDEALFHSYRRDGKQAGRMVAMISIKNRLV